jgi:predicted nuclease of predicted toxin-antitoxin system
VIKLLLARAADLVILDRAVEEARVVVTLDSDFARIVAVGGLTRPSLIHLRLPRVTRQVAVKVLTEVIPKVREDLALGCVASVTRGGVRVRRLPVR